jgi:hypothetical protein
VFSQGISFLSRHLVRTEFLMSVTSQGRLLSIVGRSFGFAAACACVVAAGCNKQQSTADRIKQAAEASGIKSVTVYPLAGTVTVDNQSADLKSKKWGLIVMACDVSKPDGAATGPFVHVKSDGNFEFPDGGIPPGKYVLLFAGLQRNKRKGWVGPDALKNLYNDPDVNGKKEQFTIDHQSPGKTNYSFNLSVAGETPVAAAGPRALTHISD